VRFACALALKLRGAMLAHPIYSYRQIYPPPIAEPEANAVGTAQLIIVLGSSFRMRRDVLCIVDGNVKLTRICPLIGGAQGPDRRLAQFNYGRYRQPGNPVAAGDRDPATGERLFQPMGTGGVNLPAIHASLKGKNTGG